tara:strand:+ start:2316 stop:3281 length:966 start_codon:yes stop_codon:yes gene_type:complete
MANRDWIKDFVACYDVTDSADLAIGRARIIKAANLPKRLYKFRGVSDYSLDNLKAGTVWMCSPLKFNDPYDCAATISARQITGGTIELPEAILSRLRGSLNDLEIAEALASNNPIFRIVELVLLKDTSVPREKVPGMVEALLGAQEHVLQPLLDRNIASVREGIKVCSFCEDHETILMWSHYASNHTGFCMEYKIPQLEEHVIRMLYPVIYDRARFDVTRFHKAAIQNGLDAFNNVYSVLQALYKAPEWAYEREWRFVLNFGILDSDQNVSFGNPSRVYLGAQMPTEYKKEASEICKQKGIPLSQMQLSKTEYRMVAEPLS